MLTVLLWVGVWEMIALLLERYIRSFEGKLLMLFLFIVVAFSGLCLRKYV